MKNEYHIKAKERLMYKHSLSWSNSYFRTELYCTNGWALSLIRLFVLLLCLVNIIKTNYYLFLMPEDTVTYTRDSVLFDMSGFTLQMAARLAFRNICSQEQDSIFFANLSYWLALCQRIKVTRATTWPAQLKSCHSNDATSVKHCYYSPQLAYSMLSAFNFTFNKATLQKTIHILESFFHI